MRDLSFPVTPLGAVEEIVFPENREIKNVQASGRSLLIYGKSII